MENPTLDPLTGAYTRAYLQPRLEEELSLAKRQGAPLSILMLDLDYFKSINDAFGHAVGDQALHGIAQRIQRLTRKSDLLFRYGGDEFVLLMPGTSSQQVIFLARRLLDSLEAQPFSEISPPLTLAISGGTATFPLDGEDIETLFHVADQRHYLAKQQGRGRIVTEGLPLKDAQRQITSPKRLIGRDEALEKAQHFLATLQAEEHALLRITGEPDMGPENLLLHIQQLARLQGYLVCHIRTTPGLQQRAYGALWEASVAGVPYQPREWPEFTRLSTWENLVREKKASGWLLMVDSWEYLDPQSKTFIETLFHTWERMPIGMIYTVPRPPVWPHRFPWSASPQEEVSLKPLHPQQTLAWLRQALSQDVALGFVKWFHNLTEGKPGLFLPALRYVQQHAPAAFQGISQSGFPEMRQSDIRPNPPLVCPTPENIFIGHHKTLAQVKSLLPEERLLSIIAPGGSGKTRLAIQALLESSAQFGDGAYFVALDGLSSSKDIPEAIANHIQVSLSSSLPLDAAVCAALRDKHMLLVLDNLEHLAGGEHYVQQLYRETSNVHFLITSRRPLNLPEERRVFLSGLETTEQFDAPQIFDTSPAVQFFTHQLRQQEPDFALTPETRPWVAQICKLSGGLPLALQMAAAWATLLPLEEIATRMEKNLGMLVKQSHAGHKTERQHSIRVVFDTFWDVLTEDEQHTLSRLAIFPATFSTEAARQIVSISPFFLDGLVQHALLWKLPRQRYQCHPLLSQFLQEKISPETLAELRKQFIAFYATHAQKIANEWSRAPRQRWQDDIMLELDNLRQAWRWALEALAFEQVDNILPALHQYYEHNGWLQEAYNTFRNLYTFITEYTPADVSPQVERLRGRTLALMGRYAYHLGQYDEAIQYLQQSQERLQTHGTREDLYTLFKALATVHIACGEYEQATACLQHCRRIAEALQRVDLLAPTLSSSGIIQYHQGALEQAQAYFSQALTYYRQENDEARVTAMLNNLGNVAYDRGAYSQALTYLEECLSQAERIEGQTLLASVLDSLAKALIAMGRYTEARAHLERGLRICQQTQAIPLAMELIINTGCLLATLGDLENAASLWRTAAKHPRTPDPIRQRGEAMLHKHGLPAGKADTAPPPLEDIIRYAKTALEAALEATPQETST